MKQTKVSSSQGPAVPSVVPQSQHGAAENSCGCERINGKPEVDPILSSGGFWEAFFILSQEFRQPGLHVLGGELEGGKDG